MSRRLGDTAPEFSVIADADRKVAGLCGLGFPLGSAGVRPAPVL